MKKKVRGGGEALIEEAKKFFSTINVGRYSQPNSIRLALKIALEQLLASGIRKRDLSRSRASII
jgi:hypothetical protein